MRISLLPALVSGCTIANPAFDLASTSGPDTGPGATTTTSTGVTTHDAATTTLATTSPTSTGAVDPTSGGTSEASTTTLSTSEGSASGESTDSGEPTSCWHMGASGWGLAGQPLIFDDVGPADPFISPDGLRLYYIALTERRPFLTSRVDRADPFPDGDPLVSWGGNDPTYAPGTPAVVLGLEEMLMINKGDVFFSTYTPMNPDKYSKPVQLAGPNTGFNEAQLTATADGALLLVNRLDGPPIPELLERASYRFHQHTRAMPGPGAAFVGDEDVTPIVEPLKLATCPALSPDGLRLFFASSEAATLTSENVDDTVTIFYTERPDFAAAWGPASKIGIANNGITCPSSVTADGCELVYHQFHYQAGDYQMFIAQRAP